MAVPHHIQERRSRVFTNILFAAVFAIPMIGWAAVAFVACVAPFAILLKSERRIEDLLMLVLFVVCYALASAVSFSLFGERWMLSGIPVIPLSFYFLHKADQREFGRKPVKERAAAPRI